MSISRGPISGQSPGSGPQGPGSRANARETAFYRFRNGHPPPRAGSSVGVAPLRLGSLPASKSSSSQSWGLTQKARPGSGSCNSRASPVMSIPCEASGTSPSTSMSIFEEAAKVFEEAAKVVLPVARRSPVSRSCVRRSAASSTPALAGGLPVVRRSWFPMPTLSFSIQVGCPQIHTVTFFPQPAATCHVLFGNHQAAPGLPAPLESVDAGGGKAGNDGGESACRRGLQYPQSAHAKRRLGERPARVPLAQRARPGAVGFSREYAVHHVWSVMVLG